MIKRSIRLFPLLAVALCPALVHAATIQWKAASGDLGTASNWDPETALTATGHTWVIGNAGAATVGTGSSYTINGPFEVGEAKSGSLTLNGTGALSVTGGNMSVGYTSNGGAGLVVLNDSSSLNTGSMYLGHRTAGTLTVNQNASVTASNFYVSTGSSGGNGTLNLYGTMSVSGTSATSIRLGNESQNTSVTLNLYSGSSLTTAGGLTVDGINGPYTIHLDGSGSTFSVAKDIAAAKSVATFSFTADEGGISTVTSLQNINITGATLTLDMDDYTGSQSMLLFSGNSITGTFGTVNWLGESRGTLVYGANSIMLTVVPEPSSVAILGGGLLVIAGAGRRLARRRNAGAL